LSRRAILGLLTEGYVMVAQLFSMARLPACVGLVSRGGVRSMTGIAVAGGTLAVSTSAAAGRDG